MTRVLLTSVCRPFGGPGEGTSVGPELFHAQITRAQGPFSLRQVIRVGALDYIAENLEAPTVVLHYPSRREFLRELKHDRYTHVGINFVVATFHKVREMVADIRRLLPGATVILGGYGTVLPDEVLSPHCDAICREEGIKFVRRLLGEPEDAPIRTPHAPVPAVKVLGFQPRQVVGHVTAGLGCSGGCDFCCTSHFFNRRYIPFLTSGRELYEALIETRERARADGVRMGDFFIIDEDFFNHQTRAREFLDCVREGGRPLSLAGFSSVRALSRFTAREIAAMGFDMMWVGFEGRQAGYAKLKGRPLADLYHDLKSVGCAQLASMIIGFPYQDEAIIRNEFDELMTLEPALIQCMIYCAFPGTPFHTRVVREGRYLDELRDRPDLRQWDGFAMHLSHPHFPDPKRLETLQQEIYREDFRRLGPSAVRLARVWLTGFENLRDDPDPLLRARADRLRKRARATLPVLSAAAVFGPSAIARHEAVSLRKDIVRLTGSMQRHERLAARLSPLMYLVTGALQGTGVLQQPRLLRNVYNGGQRDLSLHTSQVLSQQSGGFRSLAGALLGDLGNAARKVAGHLSPALGTSRHLQPDDRIVTTTEMLNLTRSKIPNGSQVAAGERVTPPPAGGP